MIFGRIRLWLMAFGGAVIALFAALARAKREGRKEVEHEQAKDALDRIEKGQDRVRNQRGLDPDERLRRNDSQW